MDGQRILGAAVNITVVGTDRFGSDHHTFKNGMRIRFEDTAVHEGTRVALVGIAKNIFNVPRRLGSKFPFQSRWEAGAASAP